MSSAKRQREEACYICNHYHDYEGGERCDVCGHVIQDSKLTAEQTCAMPTQILPGFLYLGSYDHASRLELLKAMGITHILSVVPSCQELYRNSFTYHTIQSNPADFEECFKFIEGVQQSQKRVVIHCMTGVTKSPTVVIGYLMKLRGWTLQESYNWVRDRHKPCNLTAGDAQRLQELELRLRGSSSTGFHMQQPSRQGDSEQEQAGRSNVSSGPFAWGWRDTHASQPSTSFQSNALPSLFFGQAQQQQQQAPASFVFGSQSQPLQQQQQQSEQAAMDA